MAAPHSEKPLYASINASGPRSHSTRQGIVRQVNRMTLSDLLVSDCFMALSSVLFMSPLMAVLLPSYMNYLLHTLARCLVMFLYDQTQNDKLQVHIHV